MRNNNIMKGEGWEIINGDAAEELKKLKPESVDIVITSPPYDNIREYDGFSFDFEAIAQELFRVVREGAVVVWIVNDQYVDGSMTGTSFRHALYFKDVGFRLHDVMIWDKGTFPTLGAIDVRYPNSFEFMLILSKGKPKTFNALKDRKNKHFGRQIGGGSTRMPDGSTKRRPKKSEVFLEYGLRHNVWRIFPENSNRRRKGHPAQFPEDLVRDHLSSWSRKGDVVLDPFLGSGTTLLVAQEMARVGIGIEISKRYCDIARRRVQGARIPLPFDINGEGTN